LALIAMISGVLLYLLAGITAPLAMRSQQAQYYSLITGWHLIRSFLTLQVIIQAVLIVLLSYWCTAIFGNNYIPQLIIVVPVVAFFTVWNVLASLFRPIDPSRPLQGTLITHEQAPELWEHLRVLADRVGTAPPDHIIGGIDDKFFVTENPVRLDDKDYKGRTLYVSLSLLQTLDEEEASAILAHEMAHFRGNDTFYSKKIAPLLNRYDHFLEALYKNYLSRPLFYCAALFRNLYEVSLGKISREREFRADRIAADLVSPRAFLHAMVRTISYSRYREQVENDLINAGQHHDEIRIRERIEQGFYSFAPESLTQGDLSHQSTVHPFDSHPPLHQRLSALGQAIVVDELKPVMEKPGDGEWFRRIIRGEEMEKELWTEYEKHFQSFHDSYLSQQFLPANDEERAIVETYYPPLTLPIHGNQSLKLDYEKVQAEGWKEPLYYTQMQGLNVENDFLGRPTVQFMQGEEQKLKVTHTFLLSKNLDDRKRLLEVLDLYLHRHHLAREFQRIKSLPPEEKK